MSLLPTPLIAAPPRRCYMPCSRCVTLALPCMWLLRVEEDSLHYFTMTCRHEFTEQQVKQEEVVSRYFWSSSAHRDCCGYYETRCQIQEFSQGLTSWMRKIHRGRCPPWRPCAYLGRGCLAHYIVAPSDHTGHQ